MHHQTRCCCCDARTGLRVLGWYWLIECIFSLFYIWLPGIWLAGLVNIIALFPPFLAFLKMTGSNDSTENRHHLAKTYLYFGIIFGLIGAFSAYIYLQTQAEALLLKICELNG